MVETKIDKTDLNRAASISGTWSPSYENRTDTFYVMTKVKGKTILLHRFILSAPRGTDVDHKNHDTLNNTRENIIVGSHADNMRNCRPHRTNTSGIPGISYSKKRNRYEVYKWIDGKKKHLGRRKTLEEAKVLLYGP
ncbi:HNH endonuclease [uncultured Robinsoniella sp.]|uniref:HNH endonuclease n=1 Tax=uncultured Robinsoniella sp. TaxID=904190 RepID=UPI00374E84FB